MDKYQVFDINDPTGKIIAVVEAPNLEAARAIARGRNPNYTAAPYPESSRRTWESGVRTVSLREDLSHPGTWQAVVDALLRADSGAMNPDVQTDDTGRPTFVTYNVGDQVLRRSWSVAAGDDGRPAIMLGDPEDGAMKFEPTEAWCFTLKGETLQETVTIRGKDQQDARRRLDTLQRLAESFGLSGRGVVEFIRGRDPIMAPPGPNRRDYLKDVSKALNPGRSATFHEAYARGRD